MHWIKATRPDGGPQYLNMSACVSMIRQEVVTIVYFGGIAVTVNDEGIKQAHFSNAMVKETPEELLSLPREMIGMDRFVTPQPAPAPAPRRRRTPA